MPVPPPPSVMTTGERLTLTYTWRGSTPLKVDIYPFQAKAPITSGASSFPPPSPFVLFLYSSPSNPFFAGSRHMVPPWLMALCAAKGWPLLSPDLRLAPEATLSDMWDDVQALWAFIADEGGMNWNISMAGGGSEADSGNVSLADGFVSLQHRGGLDASKACVFAGGASAYLAALGGAMLKPQPAALVLANPILELSSPFYSTPRPPPVESPPASSAAASKRRSARISSVLSRSHQPLSAILSAPDISSSLASKALTGVNVEPWWRTKVNKRELQHGLKMAKERVGLYQAVLRSGRLAVLLEPPFDLTEVLLEKSSAVASTSTTPFYPPVMILSSMSTGSSSSSSSISSHSSPSSSSAYFDTKDASNFLALLRKLDPVAAAMDSLLLASLQTPGISRRADPLPTYATDLPPTSTTPTQSLISSRLRLLRSSQSSRDDEVDDDEDEEGEDDDDDNDERNNRNRTATPPRNPFANRKSTPLSKKLPSLHRVFSRPSTTSSSSVNTPPTPTPPPSSSSSTPPTPTAPSPTLAPTAGTELFLPHRRFIHRLLPLSPSPSPSTSTQSSTSTSRKVPPPPPTHPKTTPAPHSTMTQTQAQMHLQNAHLNDVNLRGEFDAVAAFCSARLWDVENQQQQKQKSQRRLHNSDGGSGEEGGGGGGGKTRNRRGAEKL